MWSFLEDLAKNDLVQSVAKGLLGEERLSALLINRLVEATRNRPHPWSTRDTYVSWSGLTDKTYNARLLPDWTWPGSVRPAEPPLEEVVALFLADPEVGQRECPKSTCLFPAFAQYLTDGFLRTQLSNDEEKEDRRRTTSNHDIDESALYGRTETQTRCLRLLSEARGERGRLRSQLIDGEEWSPFLLDGERKVRPEFLDERGEPILDMPLGIAHSQKPETLFAAGGDRVNAAPQTAMMNTLFLREHNRLAGLIEAAHSDWDDEHVFQVARNVVIVMFIKIVVEDYINHINTSTVRFLARPEVAWSADWNRPNWMTTEFTLLYRWHSLVPQKMRWAGRPLDGQQLLLDNSVLLDGGLADAFVDQSANHATELGLGNAASFMAQAEGRAIEQGRVNRLQGYAAYRRSMGMDVPGSFAELVGRGRDASDRQRRAVLAESLTKLYGTVERLEYYPGLFAEPRDENGPLPPLIQAMVAMDAFSQALTNPLLSEHVWGDSSNRLAAFTRQGLDAIESTSSLRDVLSRCSTELGSRFVGMTRKDWERE